MEIFDYDNILLLPRRCVVNSRRECDPSVEFGGRQFRLPVVPANMKTVVDERIADFLHQTRACDDAAGHSKYRDFCTRVTLGLFAADQFKF